MRENYLCPKSICKWTAHYGQGRAARILSLSLPIIAGMISQNILNLIDTAMVGSYGNAALAAVGLGGFFVFLTQSLFLGASTGVQTVAARRKGEGKGHLVATPLNAALLVVLLVATPYSFVLFFFVGDLFPYLNSDPEVINQAVPYIEVRVISIVLIAVNYSFRGFWNAVDMSKVYMGNLMVTHVVNVILNYVFIFGNFGAPEMGVYGAGLATTIATGVGTILHLYSGFKHARPHGFLKLLPARDSAITLFKMSLTAGGNHALGIAGFTTLFWIIGKMGTAPLAAANIILNVSMTVFLPAMGFGLAAATLVGQSLGEGKPADAKRWGWDTMWIGSIALGVISIPLWMAPEAIVGFFVNDPETIALAQLPLRVTGISLAIDAAGMILMNALFGAGANKSVFTSNLVVQWGIFLPLAYLIGPILGMGLTVIWIAQVIHRVSYTAIFGFQWSRGAWQTVRV